MGRKGVRKALAKIGKAGRKVAKKIKNDPEVRELARNTAQQFKSELLNGMKSALKTSTGGRITGDGDYVLSKNINRGSGVSNRSISVASSIIIERREFVGQIVSSATNKAQNLQKFRVNPGDPLTFPWGSNVALGYESYEPLSMQFIYEATSGDALNATDTSLGKVALAAQYNTYARDWDTFFELENANDSVVCKPSESAMLGIECKKSLRGAKTLYVSATDPTTSGKGFYDVCDVYVSTIGLQGQSVRCGDLFVVYRLRLFNPIVRDSEFPACGWGISGTVASANVAWPLSTAGNVVDRLTNRLGGTVVTTSGDVITVTGIRPFYGRVRLTLQNAFSGSVGSRNGAYFTVTASSLGVALTVTADTYYVTSSATGVNFGSISVSGLTAGTSQSWVLPATTDSFVITASGKGGQANDDSRFMMLLTPYEATDF